MAKSPLSCFISAAYWYSGSSDLINESDELEAELQDIQSGSDELTVTMKDGSKFILQVKNAG